LIEEARAAGELKQWFYLRYLDPPDRWHLRLRLLPVDAHAVEQRLFDLLEPARAACDVVAVERGDYFREHGQWPVTDIVAKGREQLAKGLNRDLAPGVRLTADVKAVQGLSVHAQRSAIRVRARADANARLTVKQGTQ